MRSLFLLPSLLNLFPGRTLLGSLLSLVVTVVPVLGLLSTLLALLGSTGLLGGLLSTVVTLVISLITPLVSSILGELLPIITSSGLLSIITGLGLGGSFPVGGGGTASLLSLLTPILGALLPVLLGSL